MSQQARKPCNVFMVFSLKVPDNNLCGGAARGGTKGHNVGPAPCNGDLGNVVLTATQNRAQVLKGCRAEEFNMNDFTVSSIRVSVKKNEETDIMDIKDSWMHHGNWVNYSFKITCKRAVNTES